MLRAVAKQSSSQVVGSHGGAGVIYIKDGIVGMVVMFGVGERFPWAAGGQTR
jgi:hypothetical protein